MHQYVANRNVFRNCLKLFPPIIGFRELSGRNSRRRTSHTDSPSAIGAELVARIGAVGWRIGDVAAMWHLRLVGTIPQGTEGGGSWLCKQLNTMTPSLYTRLAQEHPANVATSLSRTCGYRWPHGLRRSTLVGVCWLLVVAFGAPARTALQ